MVTLQKLNTENAGLLFEELSKLSDTDRRVFFPHSFEFQSIMALIDEPGNFYFLFYDDTKFVGYGMLRTFGKYSIPTLGCVVWELYRGAGYSKALVSSLLNEAKSLGFMVVRLKVADDNHVARELYESVGFKYLEENPQNQWWMEYKL